MRNINSRAFIMFTAMVFFAGAVVAQEKGEDPNSREARQKALEEEERKKDQQEAQAATRQLFSNAEKAYGQKAYNTAYMYYKALIETKNSGYVDLGKVADKISEIEGLATAKLRLGKVWEIKKRYSKAAEAYVETIEEFGYTPPAAEAKRKLTTLRERPSVKAALMYAEGQLEDDAGNYYEAYLIYEKVQKKWPSSIAALRARVAIKSMRADEFKMQVLEERKHETAKEFSARFMLKAKSFLMNSIHGRKKKILPARIKEFEAMAVKELKRIVDRFPNTKYAETAADVIIIINAGDPYTASTLLAH